MIEFMLGSSLSQNEKVIVLVFGVWIVAIPVVADALFFVDKPLSRAMWCRRTILPVLAGLVAMASLAIERAHSDDSSATTVVVLGVLWAIMLCSYFARLLSMRS